MPIGVDEDTIGTLPEHYVLVICYDRNRQLVDEDIHCFV